MAEFVRHRATGGPIPPRNERAAGVKPEVRVYSDAGAVARGALEIVIDEAAASIHARGRFNLALSGGTTPRLLYEFLAEVPPGTIDWNRVHLFWGDERCVPEGDAESNYQTAYEALLCRVLIPEANIHRIRGEHPDPHGAAIEYDRFLRKFFAFPAIAAAKQDYSGRAPDATPEGLRPDSQMMRFARTTFDLILLGMGEDGHTASLFPGDPVLRETRHWVYAVSAPRGIEPSQRVTLTLPAIASASRAVFLVTGAKKRDVLAAVLRDPAGTGAKYPASLVTATHGVLWLVDEAVAGVSRG